MLFTNDPPSPVDCIPYIKIVKDHISTFFEPLKAKVFDKILTRRAVQYIYYHILYCFISPPLNISMEF